MLRVERERDVERQRLELIKGEGTTVALLGKGACGEVRLITYRAAMLEVVYLYFGIFMTISFQAKLVPAARKRCLIDSEDTVGGAYLFMLRNEAAALAQLQHPNIISKCPLFV